MALETSLKHLLEPNLGSARDTYQGMKYNCPKPGCDQGNKYNLEICLDQNDTYYLMFHCWACHYKGHVTLLLKEHAINESWKHIKELQSTSNRIKGEVKEKKELQLPSNCIPFYLNKEVSNYLLNERKIPKDILIQRKVQYVYGTDDYLSNHIIFPFYDITGNNLIGMCIQNFETKKYKNLGRLNYVPYINFINIAWPITLTEGVYDALSVINAIPLLGTDIPKEILGFLFGKQVILALDREVNEEDKMQKAELLGYYGVKDIIIFSNPYKDLNEFKQKDEEGLIQKYNYLFDEFYKINYPNGILERFK